MWHYLIIYLIIFKFEDMAPIIFCRTELDIKDV